MRPGRRYAEGGISRGEILKEETCTLFKRSKYSKGVEMLM